MSARRPTSSMILDGVVSGTVLRTWCVDPDLCRKLMYSHMPKRPRGCLPRRVMTFLPTNHHLYRHPMTDRYKHRLPLPARQRVKGKSGGWRKWRDGQWSREYGDAVVCWSVCISIAHVLDPPGPCLSCVVTYSSCCPLSLSLCPGTSNRARRRSVRHRNMCRVLISRDELFHPRWPE
jgi:hypothetical protein